MNNILDYSEFEQEVIDFLTSALEQAIAVKAIPKTPAGQAAIKINRISEKHFQLQVKDKFETSHLFYLLSEVETQNAHNGIRGMDEFRSLTEEHYYVEYHYDPQKSGISIELYDKTWNQFKILIERTLHIQELEEKHIAIDRAHSAFKTLKKDWQ